MHLAILTQYWPPEVGAPQARLSELARHFVQAGHRVTTLTAMPSYPKGKVFDGYGGVFSRETEDGVEVLRSFVFPSQSARMLPRLTSYFSFVGSSAVTGLLPERPDFLMVESPPLFLGITGMWLSALRRTPMIFNVSDLWPDGAVRLGVVREGSASFRAASRLEALCYRRAALVTGQSRSILRSIEERFPRVPTFHLSNGCDTKRYGARFAEAGTRARLDPEGGRIVCVYAGLHGLAQGLSQILDVAERLRADDRFRFVLVGDGPEKRALIEDAKRRDLRSVRFLDAVPAREVAPLLASADVILVTLKMEIPGAVPSKIYEAMASERPLVLVATGEAADIVRQCGGDAVEPGDIAGVVSALERIAADQPATAARVAHARREVELRFDRATIAARFIAHLEAKLGDKEAE